MAEKPKAFIFDWDNTLVSSWDMIYDIMNHALKIMRFKKINTNLVDTLVKH